MKPPRSEQDRRFDAGDAEAEKTLVQALRHWLPGTPWSEVRQLIAARRVTINGNLTLDEGRRIRSGDVVKLLAHPAAPPPKEADVRVRFLDAHLIVVDKPSGMTTLRHPEERNWPRQRRQLQPTLDELLPRIIDKRGRGGKPPAKGLPRRVRAVHRLDRETSGLMIFARTVQAESALGRQFRDHSLDRRYIAIARGHITATTFESNLVEDRGDGRRGSTRHPKQGKHAITHVRPIEWLDGYTVLECRLETGRTHQIRIHLSEAGFPLCGDKVYRGPFPGTPIPDESGASRLALHAAELGFTHPITEERVSFSSALPLDMVELINRLRGGFRRRSPRGGTAGDRTPGKATAQGSASEQTDAPPPPPASPAGSPSDAGEPPQAPRRKKPAPRKAAAPSGRKTPRKTTHGERRQPSGDDANAPRATDHPRSSPPPRRPRRKGGR